MGGLVGGGPKDDSSKLIEEQNRKADAAREKAEREERKTNEAQRRARAGSRGVGRSLLTFGGDEGVRPLL